DTWQRTAVLRSDQGTDLELSSYQPQFFLVDQHFEETPLDGYDLIREYREARTSKETWLGIMTDKEEMTERVRAIRTGIDFFLTKPIRADRIVDLFTRHEPDKANAPYAVLLVDEDLKLGRTVTEVLDEIGIDVVQYPSGRDLIEKINEHNPQLVLLDMELSDYAGLELLKALRSDSRYGELTLVMMSMIGDHALVQEAFQAGADGFIFKPIDPRVFQAQVLSFRRRYQLFEANRMRDYLTGLYNRKTFTDLFDLVAADSLRNDRPLAMALIDIDDFKTINDNYGHTVGDEVLTKVGFMLRNAFRKDDLVARWGGEEFVILFRDLKPRQASFLVGSILQDLRVQRLISSQPGHQVTFSSGVAGFPRDGTNIIELSNSADVALYAAKTLGKDRVLRYENRDGRAGMIWIPEILLVEAQADIVHIPNPALDTIGFSVRGVRNVKAAIECLDQHQSSLSS
ncbi:MAG: diguanylate cyclase, partial [Verrucomicrobiota bacterium]